LDGEQSNTSVIFGDRLIMKVFRRLADGLNPDLEITRFLTEQTTFRGTPRLAGALEYSTGARGTFERFADVGGVATLAVLQEYVGGARDGWRWLLDRLAAGDAALDGLRRLGTRTAELHAALATPTPDPAFGAETITPPHVAAWADGVRRQVVAAREAARGRALPDVPDLGGTGGLGGLVSRAKIRDHGGFHLGPALAVGDGRDFGVLAFRSEPSPPLGGRRPRGVSRRLSHGGVRRALRARLRRGVCARGCRARSRKGGVRDRLRGEQPARLGGDTRGGLRQRDGFAWSLGWGSVKSMLTADHASLSKITSRPSS